MYDALQQLIARREMGNGRGRKGNCILDAPSPQSRQFSHCFTRLDGKTQLHEAEYSRTDLDYKKNNKPYFDSTEFPACSTISLPTLSSSPPAPPFSIPDHP